MQSKCSLHFQIFKQKSTDICIMNQQMHSWSTVDYIALYYTVPTCFDTISSSSGSS